MIRDRNKIEKGLKEKGFKSSEGRNHKIFSYTSLAGSKTAVYTIISRGQKHRSFGDEIISSMSKSLGISTGQFSRLIDCDMSQVEFESCTSKEI